MPTPVLLDPALLHLHRVQLRPPERRLVQCLRHLSPAEAERASHCRNETGYRHFVVMRSHLREIVGQRIDIAPSAVQFIDDSQGRPMLDPRLRSRLGANLQICCATAGDLGIVALASAAVGIAIEVTDAVIEDPAAEAKRWCSARELDGLHAVDEVTRKRLLRRVRTLKAAAMGALDGSLSIEPTAFSVDSAQKRQQLRLDAHAGIVTQRAPGTLRDDDYAELRLSLRNLEVGAEYVAAAAVAAAAVSVHWR